MPGTPAYATRPGLRQNELRATQALPVVPTGLGPCDPAVLQPPEHCRAAATIYQSGYL